jgi:hypothetical protein
LLLAIKLKILAGWGKAAPARFGRDAIREVSETSGRRLSCATRKTAAASETLRFRSGKKKLTGGTNASVALSTPSR